MNGEVRAIETVDMMMEKSMIQIIRNQREGESTSRRLSAYERRIKKEIVRYAGHAAEREEDE